MSEDADRFLNETRRGKYLVAAVTVGMTPVNAIVQSWTLRKLWTWFLSPEYGSGPSMGAWYGINALLGVMFAIQMSHIARKEGWDKPAAFLYRALELPTVCLLILAATWIMGSIMGWMA